MLISTEKVTPDTLAIKPLNELLIANISYELRNYAVDKVLNRVEAGCEEVKYPTRVRVKLHVTFDINKGLVF